MIRLFNVHFPVRSLVLVAGEAVMILASFLLGVTLRFREDSFLVLNFEHGYHEILILTFLILLIFHGFDLYDPVHFDAKGEFYFPLLLVPGVLALLLAMVGAKFPHVMLGKFSLDLGLIILVLA